MPGVVSVIADPKRIKEIFSICLKLVARTCAAVGPDTLHPVSGQPAVSRGSEVLS